MCADWSIHDKNDGNPHVHLLVTMRPFNLDHSWGSKEVKDWDFAREDRQIGSSVCHWLLHLEIIKISNTTIHILLVEDKQGAW